MLLLHILLTFLTSVLSVEVIFIIFTLNLSQNQIAGSNLKIFSP